LKKVSYFSLRPVTTQIKDISGKCERGNKTQDNFKESKKAMEGKSFSNNKRMHHALR
jgi:hypothetical protein